MKNVLTKALGVRGEVDFDVAAYDLVAGDTVLLCSDGLTNMLDDDAILEIVSGYDGHLAKTCDQLVDSANARGGATTSARSSSGTSNGPDDREVPDHRAYWPRRHGQRLQVESWLVRSVEMGLAAAHHARRPRSSRHHLVPLGLPAELDQSVAVGPKPV
jgi:stage II sporulation SpoE-like protein